MSADVNLRQTRLTALRSDIARGVATARRLPEFEAQVSQLEGRLDNLKQVLPEEKDVADILRRIQGLATQSNLSIQRFTPQAAVQQALYAEIPYRLQAEGTYHNLGLFFDRVSKFPRIINVSQIGPLRSIADQLRRTQVWIDVVVILVSVLILASVLATAGYMALAPEPTRELWERSAALIGLPADPVA